MVPEYHASAGQACPDSRENVAGRLDRSDADAAGMIREAPKKTRLEIGFLNGEPEKAFLMKPTAFC
jgi:hypothetical protein